MNILKIAVFAVGPIAVSVAPGFAQEAETAYRMRASIYAEKAIVTAATWVGIQNRITTVKQTFSTPYQRDIALNAGGKSAEGVLEGEVTMSVRPFDYRGTLCLNVEIASHTVSRLHHYKSKALLEVLPGGGSYSAGGDFCDFRETDEGLLFDLSLNDEDNYAEILVAPERPVKGAGKPGGNPFK